MSGIRVLIAAGGSGGHIFPAIALAHSIKEISPDAAIRFIGSNKALDRRIFEKEGFEFSLISANKFPGKISFSLVLFPFGLLADTVRAFFMMIFRRPDVAVGFGGYVSCPVMIAAFVLGVPRVLHEQNLSPGRANKLLSGLADKVCVSFRDTIGLLGRSAVKGVYTGNPIRGGLLKDDKAAGINSFGLSSSKFTILVVGGSQGARFLNEAFIGSARLIDKSAREYIQVIHLTGVKDYEWAVKAYAGIDSLDVRVFSFIDRIAEAYSAADLVVTRSGASAIFEVAFFGRPMILVPYPLAMGHQSGNARAFANAKAAIVIEEKDLSPQLFKDNILKIINTPAAGIALGIAAKQMSRPGASRDLAGEVLAVSPAGREK